MKFLFLRTYFIFINLVKVRNFTNTVIIKVFNLKIPNHYDFSKIPMII